MPSAPLTSDPRFALASLGARSVYMLLRRLRDETDAIAPVHGHTLATSLAAVLVTAPSRVAEHLQELLRLGLVEQVGDGVRLLPRAGQRALVAGGAPRVAMTPAEKQKAYRARAAARASGNAVTQASGNAVTPERVTEGNGVTPTVTADDALPTVTHTQSTAENTPQNGSNGDGNGGNATVTAGNAPADVVSPAPPSSPTSWIGDSSPPSETLSETVQSPPARDGQGDAAGKGEGFKLAAEEPADKADADGKRKRRPKPAPKADPVPPVGSPARAVYDAIVGDPGLREITAGPGDYALRITDPRRYPNVNVLAVVLDAAEYLARGEKSYTNGRQFLANQLQTALDRELRKAKPLAGSPAVALVRHGRAAPAPVSDSFDDDGEDPLVAQHAAQQARHAAGGRP